MPCYEQDGQVTVALDPVAGSVCRMHAAGSSCTPVAAAVSATALQAPGDAIAAAGPDGADPVPFGRPGVVQGDVRRPERDRPGGGPVVAGRGPLARVCAARTRSGRPGERHRAARRRACALRTGRVRAIARVQGEGFEPHPGWRNFLPAGVRVLLDQAEALQVLRALVDEQGWRCDRAHAWWLILRQLVLGMDWETGLISAVTFERLAAAGARAKRTVSRVIAWAQEAGVLVVVEGGASAAWLGTDQGRTPTYALVTTHPLATPTPDTDPDLTDPDRAPIDTPDPQVKHPNGAPPTVPVPITTRPGRIEPATPASPPRAGRAAWPLWQVPQTPTDRTAAARRLGALLGLGEAVLGRVGRCSLARWWALLRPWWAAGWCPAGLAWAVNHHPDTPDRHRGDLRGARDPLAVVGARLRPWRDRAGELPANLVGLRGDYRTAHRARLEARLAAAGGTTNVETGACPDCPDNLDVLAGQLLAALPARRPGPAPAPAAAAAGERSEHQRRQAVVNAAAAALADAEQAALDLAQAAHAAQAARRARQHAEPAPPSTTRTSPGATTGPQIAQEPPAGLPGPPAAAPASAQRRAAQAFVRASLRANRAARRAQPT